MKKKQQQQQQQHHQQKHGKDGKELELEITKAVAQAWYGRSTSSKSSSTTEFDTPRRQNFKSRPSRFKLEAMRKASLPSTTSSSSRSEFENGSSFSATTSWDFGQSLWDSYEIVAISKRLERGLALDYTFCLENDEVRINGFYKKKKESKNSLRNLLNKMSSRRFNEPIAPDEEGNEFH
ncbi:OLC1v1013240C1 [Oldenlandia corymbosa var. corymbosa]|uniref:OLC1v1013240C1 n=1 Tax=Oldenlandia corymbosa var. corymbosa TaxID=529605 RepID=A0AAV1DY12_OLDCO|nr:OLC1v1013240C1 [Oldenlandia corymbosa var. corymbosa]